MNRFSVLAVLVAGSLPLTVGCATKKYVRNEVTPIINKVNELDDLTAKNTRDIRDVDTRAQQGIQQVNSKAAAPTRRRWPPDRPPIRPTRMPRKASNRVTSLAGTVENLDNYKPVGDTTVLFGFDKADLTRKDKQTLDDFAQQLAEPEALHRAGGGLHRFDRPGRLQLPAQPAPRRLRSSNTWRRSTTFRRTRSS